MGVGGKREELLVLPKAIRAYYPSKTGGIRVLARHHILHIRSAVLWEIYGVPRSAEKLR